MSTFLTDDTKAIILLCSVLGKADPMKPLTQMEYTALARWLRDRNMRPADLLCSVDTVDVAKGIGVAPERLTALLGRGTQVGFAVEEWHQSGVWVISRSDPEYPKRYKDHLREKSPPLLFGVGDKSLLHGGGLAIVGSRNVDDIGEAFTRQVGERCAQDNIPVISGAARGVDQTAMSAALETGGVVIGVVAENLLKKAVQREARHAIADERLLLISPYYPKARFTVGNAMGRNKLIYALADYALVVSATHKKGGTWEGAKEELRRQNCIPVFARQGAHCPQGNTKLLDLGAVPWPQDIPPDLRLREVLRELGAAESPPGKEEGLFTHSQQIRESATPNASMDTAEQSAPGRVGATAEPPKHTGYVGPGKETEQKSVQTETDPKDAIYRLALPLLLAFMSAPRTRDDIATHFGLAKGQLDIWLKKAVAGNRIKKHGKPVRYVAVKVQQLDLL